MSIVNALEVKKWSDTPGYDLVDDASALYEQRVPKYKMVVNSVPKCGTHLLVNIVRMFMPVENVQREWIGDWNISDHEAELKSKSGKLYIGHINTNPMTLSLLANCRHIVLVRDPYDYVMAAARYLASSKLKSPLADCIIREGLGFDDIVRIIIFGSYGDLYQASINDLYSRNAVSWLGANRLLVRFEDLLMHTRNPESPEGARWFHGLFKHLGLFVPKDWVERIQVGSDPAISATWRENISLRMDIEFPSELSSQYKDLVDYQAPNLRKILGYS